MPQTVIPVAGDWKEGSGDRGVRTAPASAPGDVSRHRLHVTISAHYLQAEGSPLLTGASLTGLPQDVEHPGCLR